MRFECYGEHVYFLVVISLCCMFEYSYAFALYELDGILFVIGGMIEAFFY